MNQEKSIGIVADWLVTYAGAERVIKEIIDIYPNSDLYSVVDFLSEQSRSYFHGKKHQQHSFRSSLVLKKHIRNIFLLCH